MTQAKAEVTMGTDEDASCKRRVLRGATEGREDWNTMSMQSMSDRTTWNAIISRQEAFKRL